jgi:hypothetical protein
VSEGIHPWPNSAAKSKIPTVFEGQQAWMVHLYSKVKKLLENMNIYQEHD